MELTARGEVIFLELIKSFKIKGSERFAPEPSVLMSQAGLIDEYLEKNIEIGMIKALFDVARHKDDNPALTGLRKAKNDERFKGQFKSTMKMNYFKLPALSPDQKGSIDRGKKQLSNFISEFYGKKRSEIESDN